ncbi:MAG: hypothetical protein PHP97_00025 [Candidatus Shapirobacteria bacterium]|nr:hypothetical protein [Candidatus Shapirobacteria bacterium]MDD3002765.1 hypothetical protein [Candidatus Shapirobacteria bacterium]MDD4383511.1 hypothetical protein [Candidatus Shapirobacteria bacterium]
MFCFITNHSRVSTGIIPILPEDWNKLPKNVKKAFKNFQKWWSKQKNPKRNDMPPKVSAAYEFIKSAELPGLNGIKNKYIKDIEKEFKKNK